MKKQSIICALLVALSSPVIGAERSLSNEVELGFMLNRGNTHKTHFDSRYTNKYAIQRLSNTFSVSSLVDLGLDSNTREKTKTAEKYSILDNLKFHFTKKDYVYGQVDAQRDKFSAFDYDVTESIGYGRILFNTDTFNWHIEAGPGGRHTRVTKTDFTRTHQDNLVGHAGTVAKLALSDNAELSEDISYYIGTNSEKTKATTALKAKVFDKVSLKLSYLIEYNAKLPDTGKVQNHTDTTTSLTAVYVF